ncbi:hypothetical protein AX769_03420 [Frondihabitans sp. PAMC 28766]|uniref:hypothetical protein n=1 Tax=Frondihabitans sp. PAMC 28766 TaxID=1795630 RepID=UPI00078D6215|nr:hypothetical protein [Frondihabitans sp. PAMC 28766]AMM19355.1 hypothetical protein AX769_03420 [Frondihabitans sp. PAMC 28766]
MTNTNRFLNRALVFVIGLVLVVAGGVVAAGALVPDVQKPVAQDAENATNPTADALSGGQPWILWVTAAAALVLILLLLWFVFRQGHGRTSTLLTVTSGDGKGSPTGGTLTIDAKVAEQVLEESLARDPSIVSVDVAAFEVKKQNVLRITAQTLRGSSPVDVRKSIDHAVADWDALLGQETPVVIQIVGGIRSQRSGASRVQ